MDTVLKQTYCTFCDAVVNFGTNIMAVSESISRARAAHALSQMGYYDEAKKVMCGD